MNTIYKNGHIEDDDKYELVVTLSDLDAETYSIYDDVSERTEKTLKNSARVVVKKIISNDSMKVKKNSIKNVNGLFEQGILDDVKLLDDKVGGESGEY